MGCDCVGLGVCGLFWFGCRLLVGCLVDAVWVCGGFGVCVLRMWRLIAAGLFGCLLCFEIAEVFLLWVIWLFVTFVGLGFGVG